MYTPFSSCEFIWCSFNSFQYCVLGLKTFKNHLKCGVSFSYSFCWNFRNRGGGARAYLRGEPAGQAHSFAALRRRQSLFLQWAFFSFECAQAWRRPQLVETSPQWHTFSFFWTLFREFLVFWTLFRAFLVFKSFILLFGFLFSLFLKNKKLKKVKNTKK